MRKRLHLHLRLILWMIATVVLALSLVAQVTAHDIEQQAEGDGRAIHFVWEFYPKSFREARDKATVIVLADVVKVERGPDAVVSVKGLPNNEDRVPMQHVTVKVAKTYRGQAVTGGTMTLAQTGGGDVGFSDDDPTYQVGERYVLFLQAGRPSLYRIISPEGRYRVTAGGLVEPMRVADPNNPTIAGLQGGKPLAVLEGLLAQP